MKYDPARDADAETRILEQRRTRTLSAEQQLNDAAPEDPYAMHYVARVASANPRIAVIEPDRGGQMTMTADLVQRGLLAPDSLSGRASDATTYGAYGVSDRTLRYRTLLLANRSQLGTTL